jgi:hypothetical protein
MPELLLETFRTMSANSKWFCRSRGCCWLPQITAILHAGDLGDLIG